MFVMVATGFLVRNSFCWQWSAAHFEVVADLETDVKVMTRERQRHTI